jgi:hypothetical protein
VPKFIQIHPEALAEADAAVDWYLARSEHDHSLPPEPRILARSNATTVSGQFREEVVKGLAVELKEQEARGYYASISWRSLMLHCGSSSGSRTFSQNTKAKFLVRHLVVR